VSVALDSGSTFAGYVIESVVGRGGMGVVYRAIDLSLERPVALKLVAPELAGDELFRRRFLKEPRLAASLDHPNVVPIYEAGEHDGQLYLAMRFVDGSDMRTLLRREAGCRPSAPSTSSLRSRARSTPRTGAGSCTATSSPPTCSSTRTVTRT
jgi:serine/threonine protein kinase